MSSAEKRAERDRFTAELAKHTVEPPGGQPTAVKPDGEAFHRGQNVALTLDQVRSIRRLRKEGVLKHYNADRLGITFGAGILVRLRPIPDADQRPTNGNDFVLGC